MADEAAQKYPEVRYPHAYSWSRWMGAARTAGGRTMDFDMTLYCAGVAFFAFLSVFPAMAAAISVFGLVSDPTSYSIENAVLITTLPPEIADLLKQQLATFMQREAKFGIGLVISLAVTLWTGTRGMNALVFAITKAYAENDHRNFIQSFVLSIASTVIAVLVLAVTVIAVALLPAITALLPLPIPGERLTLWLRWPVATLIIAAGIFLLYRKAPHRRDPKAAWILPGVVAATLLWLGGSIVFSLYIENFGRYQATFGSIAAAAIFMLWLYFTAAVLVFGASLNAQLEWVNRYDTTIGSPRPMGQRGAHVADTFPDSEAPGKAGQDPA